MNTLLDICKRSIYMNLFIVVIPLIAYMIHNGSSATVALVWYLLLSLCIPWTYVSYQSSTFGSDGYHINRWIFIVSWILTQVLTYKLIFLEFVNWREKAISSKFLEEFNSIWISFLSFSEYSWNWEKHPWVYVCV